MQTLLSTLPIHTKPNIFFESNSFKVIPDDRCVVVADVRGSTAAIEGGHYRDVNFVGAACITAFMQHFEAELPYIFGGADYLLC